MAVEADASLIPEHCLQQAGEARLHVVMALSLNGSMNYVGTAVGAVLGGVVLSTAGALWLAPAAVIAAIVLGITWLTAPERRTAASAVTAVVPTEA